jgi:hypothetical protein
MLHPAVARQNLLSRGASPGSPGQRILTYRCRAWGQPQPTADVSLRRHDALRPPAMALKPVQTATWAPAHCWQAVVVASLPWGLSPPEICDPSLPCLAAVFVS